MEYRQAKIIYTIIYLGNIYDLRIIGKYRNPKLEGFRPANIIGITRRENNKDYGEIKTAYRASKELVKKLAMEEIDRKINNKLLCPM